MRDTSRSIARVTVLSLALLLVMGAVGVAAASSVDSTAGEVEVSLEPSNQTVDPGQEATYDVVVEGATEGVSGYLMTVELSDASAATVEGFENAHDPMFDNTEVYDDRVELSAAMGDNVIDGANETVLGTITVVGETEAGTDLVFAGGASEVDVADESDNQYDVTGVSGGTLAVDWPEVDVGLAPAEQTVGVDEVTSYDVVVEGATSGISAYQGMIHLADPSVATVEGFEPAYDPMFDNTVVSDDGVNLSAAMGEDGIPAGEEIVLGTLSVSGDAEGATGLTFGAESVEIALDDENVSSYTTGALTDGTLDVVDTSQAVTVELVPFDTVAPGEVTLGVVVSGADNGISAYDIDMTSNDTAATFVGHELTAEGSSGPLDDSGASDDGTTFSLTAALLDATHGPAEETHIANITVDVGGPGTYALEFGAASVQDLDSNAYTVLTESTTLAADSPPALNGGEPPEDLDGDGLYEDVDGDGAVGVFDVQALFGNLDNPKIQDYSEAYSFNGDEDTVTIFDVQGLFDVVGSGA